jgi:hypothetical protein
VRSIRLTGESGFSLAEAIVATGLLAGALASLAEMFAIAASRNRSARLGSYATVLALQKIEQLTSDTALTTDRGEWIDYADEGGTRFVRRWSIEPLPTNPDTIVVRVMVTARSSEEVRLTTIRTRKPR